MIRLHPRSTRTEHTLALHDALPILLLRKRGKHPTTTFSRTVPSPNNSRFWNVRVTPISDSRCTGRPSRSWPSYSTAPYVGLRIRLRQFNSRSEEPTSELQSLMRISYAVFCLKKNTNKTTHRS